MSVRRDEKPPQKSLPPTPLRDWVLSQPSSRRLLFMLLFAALMACGAKAPAVTAAVDMPSSHQLLFALLAGGMLGSRLGATAAMVYLVGAAATGVLWPVGAGQAPLTGHLCGFLWSLPVVAYASGYSTERFKLESPATYAIGIAAGIGIYDAAGAVGLILTADHFNADSYLHGAAANTGLRIAHGAVAVFVSSSASATLQAKSKG